jgi:Ni,Fe-hydrogenase maturation factor
MKAKILCLGNEFIKEDCLAKKISIELIKEGYNIINIKDSFQLMEELNSSGEVIILDVVEKLNHVKLLKIKDLDNIKIMTAHDFDAGFVLKLFKDKKIKIIGIPMNGKTEIIKEGVKNIIYGFIDESI